MPDSSPHSVLDDQILVRGSLRAGKWSQEAEDAFNRLVASGSGREQLEAERRKIAWMTEALRQTAEIAAQADDMPEGGELGRAHIVGMLDRIEGFSPSKLGRWLGWAQAAVVAAGAATLEDMKRINMECSAAADSFPAKERDA